MMFTRTKRGADRLARDLKAEGVKAAAIHGDLPQREREKALADFTSGQPARAGGHRRRRPRARHRRRRDRHPLRPGPGAQGVPAPVRAAPPAPASRAWWSRCCCGTRSSRSRRLTTRLRHPPADRRGVLERPPPRRPHRLGPVRRHRRRTLRPAASGALHCVATGGPPGLARGGRGRRGRPTSSGRRTRRRSRPPSGGAAVPTTRPRRWPTAWWPSPSTASTSRPRRVRPRLRWRRVPVGGRPAPARAAAGQDRRAPAAAGHRRRSGRRRRHRGGPDAVGGRAAAAGYDHHRRRPRRRHRCHSPAAATPSSATRRSSTNSSGPPSAAHRRAGSASARPPAGTPTPPACSWWPRSIWCGSGDGSCSCSPRRYWRPATPAAVRPAVDRARRPRGAVGGGRAGVRRGGPGVCPVLRAVPPQPARVRRWTGAGVRPAGAAPRTRRPARGRRWRRRRIGAGGAPGDGRHAGRPGDGHRRVPRPVLRARAVRRRAERRRRRPSSRPGWSIPAGWRGGSGRRGSPGGDWPRPTVDVDRLAATGDPRLAPVGDGPPGAEGGRRHPDQGGRGGRSTRRRAGCRRRRSISVHAPDERLAAITAVLLAPPVTAWALRTYGGTALSTARSSSRPARCSRSRCPPTGGAWARRRAARGDLDGAVDRRAALEAIGASDGGRLPHS